MERWPWRVWDVGFVFLFFIPGAWCYEMLWELGMFHAFQVKLANQWIGSLWRKDIAEKGLAVDTVLTQKKGSRWQWKRLFSLLFHLLQPPGAPECPMTLFLSSPSAIQRWFLPQEQCHSETSVPKNPSQNPILLSTTKLRGWDHQLLTRSPF